MKILYHHRTRGEDAQGVHIREIIRAMQDLGHEVHLCALRKKLARQPRESQTPIKIGQSSSNPILYELMTIVYNLFGAIMLARSVWKFSPDMIYERYSLNTFCGILVSKLFGIPIILEVNSPLFYEQKKFEKLFFRSLSKTLERWICSNATKTIVVSHVMKDILHGMGVPAEKMEVLPNGINPVEFHINVSGREIRRRIGLEGKIVLGFLGWFKRWHGLEMMIELFAEGKLGGKDVHLLLVGDGPARQELEAMVRKQDIASDVSFTGPVPREEIPNYISAIDIALQPSVNEYASPMKIFEYLAMGKCIVAPRQANILEILEHGKTALLFEPGDKEDLSRTLKAAIEDEGLRQSVGMGGPDLIFQRGYLWKNNADRAIRFAFPES